MAYRQLHLFLRGAIMTEAIEAVAVALEREADAIEVPIPLFKS